MPKRTQPPAAGHRPYHPTGYFRVREKGTGRVISVKRTEAEVLADALAVYEAERVICNEPEKITDANKHY